MQARSSLILFSLFIILCSTYASGKVITGAERMDQYLPLIKGKRVGMVVNHTSIVGTEPIHLLDTLLKQKIDKGLFAISSLSGKYASGALSFTCG